MIIKEAIVVFEESFKDNPDKIRNFVHVIRHKRWDEDKDIKEYCDYIKKNTCEWFEDLLPGYNKINAKRKTQTAINSFFGIPKVQEVLGIDYIKDVKAAISQCVKELLIAEKKQDIESTNEIQVETVKTVGLDRTNESQDVEEETKKAEGLNQDQFDKLQKNYNDLLERYKVLQKKCALFELLGCNIVNLYNMMESINKLA